MQELDVGALDAVALDAVAFDAVALDAGSLDASFEHLQANGCEVLCDEVPKHANEK